MVKPIQLSVLLTIFIWIVSFSSASAESYMGLGVGKSLRQTISGFEGNDDSAYGDSFQVSIADLGSDSSTASGIKLGHFFKDLYGFGLEFNYSFSNPDVVKEEVRVNMTSAPTGVFAGQSTGDFLVSTDINYLSTFGALLVWRVTDGQFLMNLDGLEPYAGIGIGLSFLDIEKFTVLNTDESLVGETSSENSSSVGLLITAGLNYTLTKHMKVYGEFKYKDANFEFDELDEGVEYEFDAIESSLVFGLSYHF